ncbi:MAG: GH116 family glycosyl-hydrolase, partial [Thermomicrobiales bacterium]
PYARAMASWGAVLALTGFRYAAHDATLTFAPAPGPARWFWSNGAAWGACAQQPDAAGNTVELTVLYGAIALTRLELTGLGATDLPTARTMRQGETLMLRVPRA